MGSGWRADISGVPGTGKTATVHAVVRELKRMAESNEANPFAYVEINGLKIPDPVSAYPVLWEALCHRKVDEEGHSRITPKEALKNLTKHFESPKPHEIPWCVRITALDLLLTTSSVVLMDELDQLMTTKQDVVYNFFNWPNLPRSKLIVIAVANTHDMPERLMLGKVRSRLGACFRSQSDFMRAHADRAQE